jgi:hypothetical protein
MLKLAIKSSTPLFGCVHSRPPQVSRPAPIPGTFVRRMDLLNHVSFSNSVIRCAFDNLRASPTDGGILQGGRTQTAGRNAVSFYGRAGDNLRRLKDVSSGWDLAHLLEAPG